MSRAQSVLYLHPVRADGSLQYIAMQMPALWSKQVSVKYCNSSENASQGIHNIQERKGSFSKDSNIFCWKMSAA